MRLASSLLCSLPLLCALALPASAAEPAMPTVRLKPRTELLVVEIHPAAGSHLAADLPLRARVEDGYFTFELNDPAPPKVGPGKLRVPLVRESRIATWTVQVEGATCADDGTTCVPFHVKAQLPKGSLRTALVAQPGRLPRAETADAKPPPADAKPPSASADREAPRPAAKAPAKPILYDFFATWCPPCDRVRDEFLTHPDWQPFLAGYDVRKVDADDPRSFDLKDRYRVGGYPTLLLTTPRGEVLERIVGYPGAKEVARRLRTATDKPTDPSTASCAEALPTIRAVAAQERHEEALSALVTACTVEELEPIPGGLLFAFDLAEAREDDARALIFALAAARTTSELGVMARLADRAVAILTAADRGAEGADILRTVSQRIEAANARADLTADERIDLADALYYRGRWEPAQTAAFHRLAAEHLARAITDRAGAEPGPVPDAVLAVGDGLKAQEGLVHDLVSLLKSAEAHPAVGRLYAAMIALYPTAFTWHYAQAGWLQEQGDLKRAELSAGKALTHAYGDMALRAAQRLAQIQIAAGRPDAALATIDAALSAPEPTQEHVRTWRYREALVTLRDSVAPPGPR